MFCVVAAVRGGDLKAFAEVVTKYHDKFMADNVYNLITR